MIALYTVAVVAGLIAILCWVGFGVMATAVDGWGGLDPEARFGPLGRAIVAGVTGFGMGGISASYAGWTPWLALVGAMAGAAMMALLATRIGPGAEPE
jgi:hypothetical protein